MARAMNVDKRLESLKTIIAKTEGHRARAQKIADELLKTFSGVKTEEAKAARAMAQNAKKLEAALARVTSVEVE